MIVITREVARNGIAYVTGVGARARVADAVAEARAAGARRVLLGVAPDLVAHVDTSGFSHAHDTLELVHPIDKIVAEPHLELDLREVTDETAEVFRLTLNAAFADAPNSATEAPEDIARQRAEPGARTWLGYHDGAPALAAHVLMNDKFFIDQIGVLPHARRAGLGRALVRTLILMARAHALPVVLSVISSNERAMRLYASEGFVQTRVLKHWYRLEL